MSPTNFFSWSVPAGKIAGVAIRIHLLFFLYAVHRIWVFGEVFGVLLALALFVGLYLSILLHEFGHVAGARWCGGHADEILIWPLGGLAFCAPPQHPTAHLITVIAGPAVTLILWGIFAGLAAAVPYSAAFWPWLSAMAEMNLYLLLFNLIPAFPMDGGRILRDSLWHKLPYEKATRIAVITGAVAAFVMIWVGAGRGNAMLIYLALFNLVGCAEEWMRALRYERYLEEDFSLRKRLGWKPRIHRPRPAKAARGARQDNSAPKYTPKIVPRPDLVPDWEEVQEIDGILEKIGRTGMDSLTDAERAALKAASDKLKDREKHR